MQLNLQPLDNGAKPAYSRAFSPVPGRRATARSTCPPDQGRGVGLIST